MSDSDKPSLASSTTSTTNNNNNSKQQKALELKKQIDEIKLEPIVYHADGRKPIFVHGDVTNPNHGAEPVKVCYKFI